MRCPVPCVLFLLACPMEAASETRKAAPGATVVATALPTATAIKIDGELSESVWATVAPVSGFVQRDPTEGAPATFDTEVRLAFDETALYEALRDRTIGGAVLDTWYQYPTREHESVRPSRYPFHELANVIMTPHSSAWTEGMIERRWTTIAENIRRLAGGQPLLNVVHTT